MTDSERVVANGVSNLVYCNPFLPERIDGERQALGEDFSESEAVWNLRLDREAERPNIERIRQHVEPLAADLLERLGRGHAASKDEMTLYMDVVIYLLYHRYRDRLEGLVSAGASSRASRSKVDFYDAFLADVEHFYSIPRVVLPDSYDPAHLFACFFQIRRAFFYIFSHIAGGSMPAARLRAAVWQSIFTHDMRRYKRVTYRSMGDITTLILGASGTGKELVARAIGLSRYIPFEASTRTFSEDFAGSFHALSISALSPTLIESELFGHRRGAFTGALEDRAGWLETCRPLGTVFLDEVGDVDPPIQVKLLRVLQTRAFQRLGDTQPRKFQGKIIAATNRDLAAEIRAGRFREDFYYRLCSDLITTPTLHEQLEASPGELRNLLLFITQRVLDEKSEDFAAEVETWIAGHLGRDYPWPGNFRELEQCVRNVLIRKEYRPLPRMIPSTPLDQLCDAVRSRSLSADDLLRRYCTLVYLEAGSYEAAARRLGLDRRTVKSHVDPAFLEA
ncbi:MAG: sigma 54-interacting transcriptional regulator [Planctomycetes bacterium]|nr:sigma 54-interacting transcriptional regulator [Planctomycetota bacterium]